LALPLKSYRTKKDRTRRCGGRKKGTLKAETSLSQGKPGPRRRRRGNNCLALLGKGTGYRRKEKVEIKRERGFNREEGELPVGTTPALIQGKEEEAPWRPGENPTPSLGVSADPGIEEGRRARTFLGIERKEKVGEASRKGTATRRRKGGKGPPVAPAQGTGTVGERGEGRSSK